MSNTTSPNAFQIENPIASDSSVLVPLPETIDWQSYGSLLKSLESTLVRLFSEADTALGAVDYAASIADGALESSAASLQDLSSRTVSLANQLDIVNSVPLTGGQYTRLITESFRDSTTRDETASLGREPLSLGFDSGTNLSCPARPPLEVDRETQVLRLAQEADIEIFSGLPKTSAVGGKCEVDAIHGTPLNLRHDSSFSLSVASRAPLSSNDPLDSWIPVTYSGGACVRLHVSLDVPSPLTELALVGDQNTSLLETVCGIDSRPDPLATGGIPSRALNSPWHGDLTAAGLSVAGTSRWIKAPDRNPAFYPSSGLDYGLAVHGQASFVSPINQQAHYLLRYRVFSPYETTYDNVSRPAGSPQDPSSSHVTATYFTTYSDAAAGTNAVGRERFRDDYPHGSGYEGAASIVHLLTSPANALYIRISLGTDAGLDLRTSTAGGEIAFSDVWLCDEAVVRSQDLPLLGPAQGGVNGLVRVPLGNSSGLLNVSDVWFVLASDSTAIIPASTIDSPSLKEVVNAPLAGLPFSGTDLLPLRWETLTAAEKKAPSNPGTDAPAQKGFWKSPHVPKLFRRPLALADGLAKSRARGKPVASAPPATSAAISSASLYSYFLSLSTISLRRRSFASSGLYLTLPLEEIDAGVSGEIREIGVITDPPLPTLGDRVRLWVVPDSEVLVGTDRDSPTALLSRAVPLDRARPRATFHCTAEGLAGISPASSDVAANWALLTSKSVLQPAFSVPPSQARESSLGLPPFQNTLKLKHVPYINREAIRYVSSAITSGSAQLPGVYDPNAVRPLVDLVRGGTYAVTGYRPVALTLTLPNGAVVRPDSLGRPRPGELVFSGKEILQEAGAIETQTLPASPNVYAFSSSTNPAASALSQLLFNRAYITAHSPIASGLQGASLSLWWHKSSDFDASKGGILSDFDVLIPASDYTVDVATGHITITSPPPGSWADYNQVVAEYYWRVGSLAPREAFPPPNLDSLFSPFNPYLIGGASGEAAVGLYKPTQQILKGYTDTATLVSDPAFANHGQNWISFHHNNDDIWSNAGRGSSFNAHLAGAWNYWFADNAGEGVQQHIAYPGPGGGNISCWFAYNADNHPDNYTNRRIKILLEVVQGDSGTILESYTLETYPAQRGTTGLPCLFGSETDASNLTTSPPAWFPANASEPGGWTTFRASLSASSNQTVYQWPSIVMAKAGGNLAVSAAAGGTPGGTVDNLNTFAVVAGNRPEAPFAVRIPFRTPQGAGLQLHVTTVAVDGNNDGQGVMGFRTDVWWTTPEYNQGCVSPYVYDPITDQCKYAPHIDGGGVGNGSGAGTLKAVPSDLADLLAGSLQQSYPVTRNVTDYEGGSIPTLVPVNMDPLSPNYYPVFEYRIDAGGVPVLANDFSDIGPYSGTTLDWSYDYLDISPRIVLEMLPEGASALDLPDMPDPSTPCVTSPELSALRIVINARS